MGRNKDIQFLHEITGKSYKECRASYKKNNCNLYDTVLDQTKLGNIFKVLREQIDVLRQAMTNLAMAAGDAVVKIITQLKEIDWKAVADGYKRIQEDDEQQVEVSQQEIQERVRIMGQSSGVRVFSDIEGQGEAGTDQEPETTGQYRDPAIIQR